VRVGNLEGSSRLAHLFTALAALEEGHMRDDVRIVQYGDSHTASDTGTSVVRRMLQERFGDGGRGFVEVGKPWKTYIQDGVRGGMTRDFEPNRGRIEEGRVVGDGAYGLVGVAIEAERRGARAWTRITAPASRVEVDYLQQPRGGSVDVVIDGVQAGRIATRARLPSSGFTGFDVADAPHEVELRAVGDGDVRLFGLALDRARPGVVLDALGINGAQISTPLRWNEEHFDEQLRHRAPDLVILAYGTNEALDPKLELAEYERSLVELLGRVARAVPSASCLLLGPPDLARTVPPERRAWLPWAPLHDVIAIQQRVARAAGCAFYDQQTAMGGPGSMAAWAAEATPRAQSDRIHLTQSGYAQVGGSFATDLLHAYDGWRSGQREAAR
jgi:lysophospholipase L1-like esterase